MGSVAGAGLPEVARNGLTTEAKRVVEARFPGVSGTVGAGDHCPQVVGVEV